MINTIIKKFLIIQRLLKSGSRKPEVCVKNTRREFCTSPEVICCNWVSPGMGGYTWL